MKFSTSSIALLSAAALSTANPLLEHRAVCNADNCARAVTGTNAQPPATTRLRDCSSFQLATVSYYPLTTTIFNGDTAGAAKRQAGATATTIKPSSVPGYAAPCSGTARYSSACSCFGVTATTTTIVPPEVTQTIVPGPRPADGSTIQGEGPCGCTYTVTSGQTFTGGRIITTVGPVSEADCLNTADTYDNSFDADYNRSTGICRVYSRADGVEAVADDDSFTFAGQCPQYNNNPACIVG